MGSEGFSRKPEPTKRSTGTSTTSFTSDPRVTPTRTNESSSSTSIKRRTSDNDPRCSPIRLPPDDKGPRTPEPDEPSEPLKRPKPLLKPPLNKHVKIKLPTIIKRFNVITKVMKLVHLCHNTFKTNIIDF